MYKSVYFREAREEEKKAICHFNLFCIFKIKVNIFQKLIKEGKYKISITNDLSYHVRFVKHIRFHIGEKKTQKISSSWLTDIVIELSCDFQRTYKMM
jgi:hypothetical protein